jgi:hypothetical protein
METIDQIFDRACRTQDLSAIDAFLDTADSMVRLDPTAVHHVRHLLNMLRVRFTGFPNVWGDPRVKTLSDAMCAHDTAKAAYDRNLRLAAAQDAAKYGTPSAVGVWLETRFTPTWTVDDCLIPCDLVPVEAVPLAGGVFPRYFRARQIQADWEQRTRVCAEELLTWDCTVTNSQNVAAWALSVGLIPWDMTYRGAAKCGLAHYLTIGPRAHYPAVSFRQAHPPDRDPPPDQGHPHHPAGPADQP